MFLKNQKIFYKSKNENLKVLLDIGPMYCKDDIIDSGISLFNLNGMLIKYSLKERAIFSGYIIMGYFI